MTLRARVLLACLLALLASAALTATYVAACWSEPAVQLPEVHSYGNTDAQNLPNCFRAAPVNCATGNQTEEQTDLTLGGRGPALHITRAYNSQAAAEAESAAPGVMAGTETTARTSNSTKNRVRSP